MAHDININIKDAAGSGGAAGGGNRSPEVTRLAEVLEAFEKRLESAISKINKTPLSPKALKAQAQLTKARTKGEIARASTTKLKQGYNSPEMLKSKHQQAVNLIAAKKNLILQKQNLQSEKYQLKTASDKSKADLAHKNILANRGATAMFAGAGALSYAVKNLVSVLGVGSGGSSAATAALANNAAPAGTTLASYYGANIAAVSGGIQTGTAVAASAIGGKIDGWKGALAGLVVGGLLAGVESAVGANFNTGYQLNTQRKYLGNMLGTVYGSQFGSISDATLKGGQLIPGTDNLSAIASGLSGKTFGKGAFTAGAYGSAIAAYYGNELGQTPQIAGSIGSIAQLSGKGSSGSSISQYIQQLIALQIQYGGDMSANLKNISDLLAGSSIKSASQAAATVYKNNLLGPGFAGAANNYLMSGPLQQFATRTMVKGLTGVDMNDLTGSNTAKKAAALRKLQAYVGPTTTGGINTHAFATEAVLGGAAQFNAFNNAHAENLSMANHPMNKVLRKSVASNLNTLARGSAPSESQLKGMYDQSTQQVMGMRATSMNVEATTVKIVTSGYDSFANQRTYNPRTRQHGGI